MKAVAGSISVAGAKFRRGKMGGDEMNKIWLRKMGFDGVGARRPFTWETPYGQMFKCVGLACSRLRLEFRVDGEGNGWRGRCADKRVFEL